MVYKRSFSGKSGKKINYNDNLKESPGSVGVKYHGSSSGVGKYAITPATDEYSLEQKKAYYVKCMDSIPELKKDFNTKTNSFPENYHKKFVDYFDLGSLDKKEAGIFIESACDFLKEYEKVRPEELLALEEEKKAKKRAYCNNRNKEIREGTYQQKLPLRKAKTTTNTGSRTITSSDELMKALRERKEEKRILKEREDRRQAGMKAHFEAIAKQNNDNNPVK